MSDRIDYTTSDEPDLPGDASGIRSTRHSGDVLQGGDAKHAPENTVDQFEEKSELLGASPDGDPDDIEAYESGQDDGQIA